MQQRFLLQILLLAQHVSGTTMSIIRSSRLLYSVCCLWYFVLWFSSCWSGVELRVMCPVCRMLQHPANRTQNSGNILHTVHTSCQPTLQHNNSYNRTDNYRQWNAVGSPDDGHKDARNMLRYYWFPINHYLLHLVGFSFTYLSKMHGHSNIKFAVLNP